MKFFYSSIVALATVASLFSNVVQAEGVLEKKSRLFANSFNLTAAIGDTDNRRDLQSVVNTKAKPIQTFFMPLPEGIVFTHMFYHINPAVARPGVETLLSISISTDLTVVWYDEWEDGYDNNVAEHAGPTTKIWGDGNADNGCAPGIAVCTHANDRLYAGDVIVIQNNVPVPRFKSEIRYDGGDRVQASYPVAIVRGSYPVKPGSLMAGAVEVLDTTLWGKLFEAPIGQDVGVTEASFELSVFFFMAGEDKTHVTLPNDDIVELNKGEGSWVSMNIGQQIISDKPIQVDLITGDLNSGYEMRWFSMLSVDQYENNYVSPVGDTVAMARCIMYNPNDTPITVRGYIRYGTGISYYTYTVEPKFYKWTHVIPSGSGKYLLTEGGEPFIALSITDSYWRTAADSSGNYQVTGSQWYDWGFPLVPRNQLTPQVIVGLGYGCTDNQCGDDEVRSVVWVTPTKSAYIYVDYENTGTTDLTQLAKYTVPQLVSIKISDPYDKDMSGARIFAQNATGYPVDIAAAWGQDASVSYEKQSISLDLGTVVLPFMNVRVNKLVDKILVSPGEELTYTIKVSNVGEKKTGKDILLLKDTLDSDVTYVANSMTYAVSSPQGSISSGVIPDDTTGSAFPLDESGLTISEELVRRGGVYEVTFKVKVKEGTRKSKIINSGSIQPTGSTRIPFEVFSDVLYDASISIDNTVYLGTDSGAKCGTDAATDFQSDYIMNNVTYCLKVTNTGKMHLKNVEVTDDALEYSTTLEGNLAPGESKMLYLERTLLAKLDNMADVIGYPIFADGADVPEADPVIDEDPSGVAVYQYTPGIMITNNVTVGINGVDGCAKGVEKASGILNTPVEYCFTVRNTGNSHLSQVTVTNDVLGSYTTTLDGILAPGDKRTLTLPHSITQDLVNSAKVVGNPVNAIGEALNLDPVTDDDPSEVVKVIPFAEITISNTVYLGHNSGASCGTDEAVEYVSDYYGKPVTYCFNVTNTGSTYLDNVDIFDTELSFQDSSLGRLAPGEYGIISHEATIKNSLKNFANVTANPVTETGDDITELGDVTAVDPSEVGRNLKQPKIEIDNTVYLGDDGGESCNTGAAMEYVEDFRGQRVTYCFVLKNTGDSHLDSIEVTNEELAYKQTTGPMAPGDTRTLPFLSEISGPLTNTATVTANPVTAELADLEGRDDVTDSDPSEVGEIAINAKVDIQNVVYIGVDAGQSCNTGVEYVEGYFATAVVYCFNVTNTGNTYLNNFKLTNEQLNYVDETSIIVLAPGDSKLVPLSDTITASIDNEARIVATPVKANGSPLPIGPVSDTDPSSVGRLEYQTGISIDNTVYIGNDGGASCDTAVEMVEDIYLTDVTYCFIVENTGETHLDSVEIVDEVLEFTEVVNKTLAPGETYSFSVPGKIRGSYSNDAVVTGNPILEDGTDIDGAPDVTDTDPSEVRKLSFTPSVTIDNTVYLGRNGLDKCGTSDASNFAEGYFGTNVTFCFKVKNTGDTHLDSIEVFSEVLQALIKIESPLAPGEETTVTFPDVIRETEVNIANVTANPITSDGRDILDLENVKANDPSEVGRIAFSPEVSIANTVYTGSDTTGEKCGTDDAKERVTANYGTAIVYCLAVTNTGDTWLGSITVVDEKLEYEIELGDDFTLPPGETKLLPVPKKLIGELSNEANVTAMPLLSDGTAIPDLDAVTAVDPSSVGVIANLPGVFIDNKVYEGKDGGAKCGTDEAKELIQGYPNTPVTVCMEVKNSGDSYLSNFKVENPKMSFTDDSTIGLLEPGATTMLFVEGTITETTDNNATVTATPVLQSGEPIPNTDTVTDTDPSAVEQLDYQASISIDNTVYFNHDGGAKCGTLDTRDYVEGLWGTEVTYCFVVTNDGNTKLNSITVDNQDLTFEQSGLGPLEPGESTTLYVEGKITKSLTNIATATGIPVTPSLDVIESLDPVTDDDDSSVGKFVFAGGVSIENTVYIGGESDDKCGTDAAKKSVAGPFNTAVTYCFLVKNTGDTHLAEIKVGNDALDYLKIDIDPLAPGESVLLTVPGTISDDYANTATVEANPITAGGQDIPDADIVKAEDSSEVVRVYVPSVSIDNTVYIGDDLGVSCATNGVESVVDFKDTGLYYCFKVENTGDTVLTNVIVYNEELAYTDNSIARLQPGASSTIVLPGVINGNVTNIAVVTAVPADDDGQAIDGLGEVTDEDPSEVAEKPPVDGQTRSGDKTPYAPPDDPDKCLQNNWEDAGKEGTLVCAAREVFIESIISEEPMACVVGEKLTVTIDASIRVEGSGASDLGWYVATDGGDALTGTCVVNGLQAQNPYAVVDGQGDDATSVGTVQFTDDGGDGDACGDVIIPGGAGGNIDIPFVVTTEVVCADENDDGVLDIAVCFTWRKDNNNDVCNFSKNIPGDLDTGCFCTRYDIPNIETSGGDVIADC